MSLSRWSLAEFEADFEGELEAENRHGWNVLTSDELKAVLDSDGIQYRLGWRIPVFSGEVGHPDIDHFLFVISGEFPYSRPRVLAPQVEVWGWPHVESKGFLCLPVWKVRGDIVGECRRQMHAAFDLFTWSPVRRDLEFKKEFVLYWRRGPRVWSGWRSLVTPVRQAKKIVCAIEQDSGNVIFGDSRDVIQKWIFNAGKKQQDFEFEPALYVWRSGIPVPSEYPWKGRDIFQYAPDQILEKVLVSGKSLRVVFASGDPAVFWGVQTGPVPFKVNGFRTGFIPVNVRRRQVENKAIDRYEVERFDHDWVHGRGKNSMSRVLFDKTVAIVGCGSLGSAIARAIAQAGVGEFVFVDDDILKSHNTARHVLGNPYVGKEKASSMGESLKKDFPNIKRIQAYKEKFEHLDADALGSLSKADLIISSGISLVGDIAINRWRREVNPGLPHLCTWVEPYAIVGQAVALYGMDDLLVGFDGDIVKFRGTKGWKGQELDIEAGCGNEFQPHGAVDLYPTVAMASRLAINMLLGEVGFSRIHTWYGDKDAVASHGGVISSLFDSSYVQRESPWPPA